MRAVSTTARVSLLALIPLLAWAGPAGAQVEVTGEPRDTVVLSGTVLVPRGERTGSVVVLRGRVTVAGVVLEDVVALSGRVAVLGQVSGDVVAVRGDVVLGPGAQVRGDVLAGGTVRAEPGAWVGGRVRQGVRFALPSPPLGRFLWWAAVGASTLVLGALLLLLAPRAAEAVFRAARGRPWASAGWGLAAAVGLPALGLLGLASVVAAPFGMAVLLALGGLLSVGYAWSVWVVGRLLVGPPRSRALAFLVGWAAARAVAAVPGLGGATWVGGAVFGLGAATVAAWRARGRRRGRHREGEPRRFAQVHEAEGL